MLALALAQFHQVLDGVEEQGHVGVAKQEKARVLQALAHVGEGEAWQGADLGLPGPVLDPAPGGGACPRLLWGSAPARREGLSHSSGHWGGEEKK